MAKSLTGISKKISRSSLAKLEEKNATFFSSIPRLARLLGIETTFLSFAKLFGYKLQIFICSISATELKALIGDSEHL